MSSQERELAAIREEAERKGWRVERGKGYWKMWCPSWCGKHWKTVKHTPRRNYARNLLGQLGRATCWNDEPPQECKEETR